MAGGKNGTRTSWVDKRLQETSRLILRAMALAAKGEKAAAVIEWLNAATAEEQVACLLEAEGRELDASVHRVSAASCYAKARQYAHAVTLLKAALSFPLREAYRREAETLLKEWLPKAKKQLRSKRTATPASVA